MFPSLFVQLTSLSAPLPNHHHHLHSFLHSFSMAFSSQIVLCGRISERTLGDKAALLPRSRPSFFIFFISFLRVPFFHPTYTHSLPTSLLVIFYLQSPLLVEAPIGRVSVVAGFAQRSCASSNSEKQKQYGNLGSRVVAGLR